MSRIFSAMCKLFRCLFLLGCTSDALSARRASQTKRSLPLRTTAVTGAVMIPSSSKIADRSGRYSVKSISIISRRRSDAFIADSPPIGVALILDYHAMGQKPCPLFLFFYKRESYNNLCISRYQEFPTYTANHIAHHLKETQNGKITYNKKEACIQVQLDFRMQALLSSPFI